MSRYWWAIVAAALLAGPGCFGTTQTAAVRKFKVGMMPKITGIAYFNACAKGAQEAARELDIDLLYDGPATDDVREQIRMLDQWIAQGIDCIAIAPNNPALIVPSLKRARDQGITVLTFDADANDARQFFVNQCTYEDIARTLVDTMAEQMGGKGKVGILTSTLQAPNQSEWAKRMRAYQAQKFPEMQLLQEVESQENSKIGIDRAKDLIQANPDLKGIFGLTSIAFPAATEAVVQQQKVGAVHVVGLSTPNEMRRYVKNGAVKNVILWKPIDLGYLTIHVADLIRKDQMKNEGTIKAGRLGEIQVLKGGEVVLGPPIKFTKENIDQFDF